MNSPSQPSDKLKAILGKRPTTPTPRPAPRSASGVEDLLDKARALPDPRALARLYRDGALAQRLPEDESEAPTRSEAEGPISYDNLPAPAPRFVDNQHAPVAAAYGAEVRDRPPMSPADIRKVVQEVKAAFGPTGYSIIERPRPVVPVVVSPDDVAEDTEEPPVSGGVGEWVYYLGALLALAVVVGFIYLALYGPAPFHPPKPSPSPAATGAASPR